MQRKDAGFTLIEVLVVLITLAVLAAIVVYAVAGLGNKGAASACKSDVKTIETAANAYFAQNQAGAPSLESLMPQFLATDENISGNTKSVAGTNGYTITFAPGADGPVGTVHGDLAGGSVTTDCSD